jgi:hypothetical protein
MIRRAILAATAAAALLLGSAPASAACDRTWTTRLPCATGEITNQWLAEDHLDRLANWLSGWVEPCGTAGAGERFGFIYYVQDRDAPGPHGYYFQERLRPYGTGRTAFDGTIDRVVEEVHGTLIGVCLAYGPGKLVHCVQPAHPPEGAPPRPPLPPMGVLAGLPVAVTAPNGTEPNCATCV